MRRLPRLAAATAVAAAALTAAPLSGALTSGASAATASISTVGTWVYPGRLSVTTTGSPAQPPSEGDGLGVGGHGVQWAVFGLAPGQPCPTTPEVLNTDQYDQSTIAYGTPTGSSFKETDRAAYGMYADDTKPLHLCGLMVESDSNGKAVTALSDVTVPGRDRNYGVKVNGGYSGGIVAIGQCQDLWPNGKRIFTYGCPLKGKMILTVSKKVKRKLGLPSTLIGDTTFTPYPSGSDRTMLAVSKAVSKKFGKWSDHSYAGKFTVTVTSPVQMTRTLKVHSPYANFDFKSWESGASTGQDGD